MNTNLLITKTYKINRFEVNSFMIAQSSA